MPLTLYVYLSQLTYFLPPSPPQSARHTGKSKAFPCLHVVCDVKEYLYSKLVDAFHPGHYTVFLMLKRKQYNHTAFFFHYTLYAHQSHFLSLSPTPSITRHSCYFLPTLPSVRAENHAGRLRPNVIVWLTVAFIAFPPCANWFMKAASGMNILLLLKANCVSIMAAERRTYQI